MQNQKIKKSFKLYLYRKQFNYILSLKVQYKN